jgi:copper chaperone CopZ
MIRRRFIELITLGTGSLAALGAMEAMEANAKETVTYHVTGYTCITCAVGLESLLRQEKGVAWAKASYPDANVVIKFDPKEVTQDSLKTYIASMGFKAEEEPEA